VRKQYVAIPKEKNVGDIAYYTPLSGKVGACVPRVPHLLAPMHLFIIKC